MKSSIETGGLFVQGLFPVERRVGPLDEGLQAFPVLMLAVADAGGQMIRQLLFFVAGGKILC